MKTVSSFNWFIILYVGLAPFWISGAVDDRANLPKSVFIQIGALVVLLLWLVQTTRLKKPAIIGSPFYLPLGVFLVWALLSLIWADNSYEAMQPWIHWMACAIAFFVVVQTFSDWASIHRFLLILFLSGFLVAVIGILQVLAPAVTAFIPQTVPPASTFANKNFVVHFVNPLVPLGIVLFATATSRKADWLFAVATSLMCLYLFYTRTKAGWVACGFEMFLVTGFLAWEWKKGNLRYQQLQGKWVPAAAGVIILLVIAGVSSLGFHRSTDAAIDTAKSAVAARGDARPPEDSDRRQFVSGIGERQRATPDDSAKELRRRRYEGSIGIRLAVWRNALEMIKDRSVQGFGLGNLMVHYPLYSRKAATERILGEEHKLLHAHNDFIQIAVELGLIGAALLLWLGIMAGVTSWRLISAVSDLPGSMTFGKSAADQRYLAVGMTVGLAGLAVNACFSFPFHLAMGPLLAMVYLGLMSAAWNLRELAEDGKGKTKRKGSMPVPVWGLRVGIAVSAILLCGVTLWGYRRVQGDRHYLTLKKHLGARQWEQVIESGERVWWFDPNRRIVHFFVGAAYYETDRPQAAVEHLSLAIAAYPNFIDFLNTMGHALRLAGKPEAALDYYERALAIKPDYARALEGAGQALNRSGETLLRTGEVDAALEKFRTAVARRPGNWFFQYNLGVAAMQKEGYEEARVAFQAAITIRDDVDRTHKGLGLVLYRYLGKKAAGIQHFERALELNPEIAGAAQLRKVVAEFRDRNDRRNDSPANK